LIVLFIQEESGTVNAIDIDDMINFADFSERLKLEGHLIDETKLRQVAMESASLLGKCLSTGTSNTVVSSLSTVAPPQGTFEDTLRNAGDSNSGRSSTAAPSPHSTAASLTETRQSGLLLKTTNREHQSPQQQEHQPPTEQLETTNREHQSTQQQEQPPTETERCIPHASTAITPYATFQVRLRSAPSSTAAPSPNSTAASLTETRQSGLLLETTNREHQSPQQQEHQPPTEQLETTNREHQSTQQQEQPPTETERCIPHASTVTTAAPSINGTPVSGTVSPESELDQNPLESQQQSPNDPQKQTTLDQGEKPPQNPVPRTQQLPDSRDPQEDNEPQQSESTKEGRKRKVKRDGMKGRVPGKKSKPNNDCNHGKPLEFHKIDERSYFTVSYLGKTPSAPSHCVAKGCGNGKFGDTYKVGMSTPVFCCKNAKNSLHPCKHAYCKICFDAWAATIAPTVSSHEGRRATTRRNR
jgi:hypothetical protein